MAEKRTIQLKSGFQIIFSQDGGFEFLRGFVSRLWLAPEEAMELADVLHQEYCPGGYNCPCVERHVADGGCSEVAADSAGRW